MKIMGAYKIKNSKERRIISRVLIIVILLDINFLTVSSTYTFAGFSAGVKSTLSLKAASKTDIVSIIGIEYVPSSSLELTQAYLVIDNVCSESIPISFEVLPTISSDIDKRNIKRYLTIPEPTLLNSGRNRIPINIKANMQNFLDISSVMSKYGADYLLTGDIKIYCYNKFINESRMIQFTARKLKLVIEKGIQ